MSGTGRRALPVPTAPLAGFVPLLGKEVREIVRTWRVYVVPGALVFCAVAGPVAARFQKVLVQSVLGSDAGMPDPTALDSWAQWAKNLQQLALLALIVSLSGVVSAERRQGTALLVLTKPVSRSAFVLAKGLAAYGLVVVSTVVAAVGTWALTAAVFGPPDPLPLIRATAVWLVLAALFVAVMLALSACFASSAASAGIGIGVYIVLSLLALWGPALRYTPAGLGSLIATFASASNASDVVWPVVTGVVTAAACCGLAILAVRRLPV